MEHEPPKRRDIIQNRTGHRLVKSLQPHAVDRIADYRVSDVRQMDPYLVGSSGRKRYRQVRHAAEAFSDGEARQRIAGAEPANSHLFPVRRAAPDRRVDCSVGFGNISICERAILPFHIPALDGLG